MRQIHSRLFVAFLWAVLACASKAPPDSTSGETAQDRKSARVQLFIGLGIHFPDKDPRAEILGMLQSNEYVGTLEDATVANLRTVSGDGIFYIRSHGGMAKDVNGADVSYALWTSSEVLD